MTTARPTPGQTIGPFFGFALPYVGDAQLVPPGRVDAVSLSGRVLDGSGAPVPDAVIELWQPDADGAIVERPGSLHRDGWTFTGWGRCATDLAGQYRFTTLTPGAIDERAPFFALTVFARGLLDGLFTRAYLPGHAALDDDALLAGLDADRRTTLIARAGDGGYQFDIHLQGEAETVFLTYRAQPQAE